MRTYTLQLGEAAAILSLQAPAVAVKQENSQLYEFLRYLRDRLGGECLGIEGSRGYRITIRLSLSDLRCAHRYSLGVEQFREQLEAGLGRLWAFEDLTPSEGWAWASLRAGGGA